MDSYKFDKENREVIIDITTSMGVILLDKVPMGIKSAFTRK